MKKNKLSALFINDLDAGAGRFGSSTQYTVNNQMVNATLMNIADNPTNVQLPGVYKSEECPRIPIICTGANHTTVHFVLVVVLLSEFLPFMGLSGWSKYLMLHCSNFSLQFLLIG